MIVVVCFAIMLAACNENAPSKTNETTAEVKTASAAGVTLPYELEKPYRSWQIGSTENVAVAMQSLKTFVDSDFAGLAATLGDSVEISLDYYHANLSKDSAVAMFKKFRPAMTDLKIIMEDYVSVISEDKKDEWVTLWYKQLWKDEKGKADSIYCTDDCKMKNGKMIKLDEKVQHFPAKK